MLFDWLVVHQVVASNPTLSVRGPKLVVSEGKTPALSAEEVAELIESIPTDTLVGLRDRALIGLMAYTFARVGAALAMNVGDYYLEGKQWSVRLRRNFLLLGRLSACYSCGSGRLGGCSVDM